MIEKLNELVGMAKEISSKRWFLNADEEVTAFDDDAGPDDSEESFIGCAANNQLAKYMAAASPESILAIAAEFWALEQRAEAAEDEIQRLNATAQPVSAPEWTNEQCLEFLTIAFRHANISGDIEMDDIRLGVRMVNETATGGQDER